MAPGEEPLIGAQVLGRKLLADVVLLADENELPCRTQVGIAQQVVHTEPEILETEFGEPLRRRDVGVEVVLVQRLAAQAAALAVSADPVSGNEQQRGCSEFGQHSAEPFAGDHVRTRIG